MSANELTLKQQRWINAYLETGNATEAARQAGYKGDDRVMRQVGTQNLAKYSIKTKIQERIADAGITADEIIGTLASQARIDATEAYEPGQNATIDRCRDKGIGHWIKAITTKRHVEGKGEDAVEVEVERVEFHSSFSALAQLVKIHGLEQMPAINDRDYARSGESALQTWLARAATAQGLAEPLEATPDNIRAAIEAMRPGAQDMPDLLAFLDQKEQSLARGQDSEAVS